MQKKRQNKAFTQGFSLIELMIVLTVIGILSAIVYPSYVSYVLKSHRVDAMTALAQYQTILERCYAQNFSYNQACSGLPSFPQASSGGYYNISLSNQSASTYTLTATSQGTQTRDTTCTTMTINQANVRSASDNSGTAQTTCWNPT